MLHVLAYFKGPVLNVQFLLQFGSICHFHFVHPSASVNSQTCRSSLNPKSNISNDIQLNCKNLLKTSTFLVCSITTCLITDAFIILLFLETACQISGLMVHLTMAKKKSKRPALIYKTQFEMFFFSCSFFCSKWCFRTF